MTDTQHNPDNTTSIPSEQLPEPASDLLEFGMILQRLANHLASADTLRALQQPSNTRMHNVCRS